MFESSNKKDLKSKYNKMSSIAAGTSKKYKGSRPEDFAMPGIKRGAAPMGTVYGELKLSEHLSNELVQVKKIVDGLNEDLEESNYNRDMYLKELNELKASGDKRTKETMELKQELMSLRHMTHQRRVESEQMIKAGWSLTDFVITSEKYRK